MTTEISVVVITSIVAIGAAIVAVTQLDAWRVRRRRERAIAAAEREYEATFDLSTLASRLDSYFSLLCSALPRAAIMAPPVVHTPLASAAPADQAKAAVDFAANRFGLVLPPFEVAFTSHMGAGRDGEVVWDAPWTFEVSGDRFIITPLPGREPNWRIRFRDGLQHDPERLLVVAAHEVAHIALMSRDIKLCPESENELLTDAAVVMAGFAPIMERAAFVVRRDLPAKRVLRWSTRRSGYLHRSAIRYLNGLRTSFVSVSSEGAATASVRVT